MGRYPVARVAEKLYGTVEKWDVGTGTSTSLTATNVSQLQWMSSSYYVATVPGSNAASCGVSLSAPTGQLWLVSASNEAVVASATLPDGDIYQHIKTRPEGVDVYPIDPLYSATCPTGADYVVYVADYCTSLLHVYTVDVPVSALPTLTHVRHVDLEEDRNGLSETVECRPASTRYYAPTGDVYALCQNRNTIIRLDAATDQCNPSWANANEATLEYLPQASSDPTCSVTPAQSTCTDQGASRCEPHDIEYQNTIVDGWLFVNLSSQGQVSAIKASDVSVQYILYKDSNSSYMPMEAKLIRNP